MVTSQGAIDDLTAKGAEHGIDLRPGLELVEQRLRETVATQAPLLREASRHLVDAGGKRFRPMLVLLAGMLNGAAATDRDLVDAGVVVELVHLSTLYHDDVIDAAEVRRGASAAHVRFSNTVAVLTGDFLLARASELSAELGVEVTRIMARTIASLCTGEIREMSGSAAATDHGGLRVDSTREHYLEVISEKTASLIAASCRLGALLSGQGPIAIEALTAYGWHLGMSFQLADDVLDIASTATESGKLPGTDLREGVRTLPVLLALEERAAGAELAALLGAAESGEEGAVDKALAILRVHPGLDLARDAAQREAERSKAAIAGLDGPDAHPTAFEGLVYLADYAALRVA